MVITMSTENNRTVKNIFDAIKYAKGLKKDSELANLVGITKQNIFNWKKRNSISDYEVFTVAGFSEHFMRTGEGPMFREPIQASANIVAPGTKITAEATKTDFDVAGGMMITKKVLESGTGYANALWHNLKSFDAAVDREDEVGEMKEMMGKIMADNKLLMEKIANIEKATVSPDVQKRDSAANA